MFPFSLRFVFIFVYFFPLHEFKNKVRQLTCSDNNFVFQINSDKLLGAKFSFITVDGVLTHF